LAEACSGELKQLIETVDIPNTPHTTADVQLDRPPRIGRAQTVEIKQISEQCF
jgi:hypothetical protein